MMLEFLNVFLVKNTGLTAVLLLFAFGVMNYQAYDTNKSIEDVQTSVAALQYRVNVQTYDFSYNLINRGFSGADTGAKALEIAKRWKAEGWDAQLTATEILCKQSQRLLLHELVDRTTAVNICRIVR